MNTTKVAIITGASSGIGRAVAFRFAAQNFNVTIVARNNEGLIALAAELESAHGIQCIVCAGNLYDKEFLRSIIDKTVAKWGGIDVLVNNAAWRTIETMRTMDLPNWEQTIGICLTAPAFLAKWAAGVMEEKSISGVIINISSVMSGRAGGISPAYIAAKGAMESLTYELAVTYGPSGIRVLCIQPGNIETNMSGDYTDEQGANISNQLTKHITDLTPLARAGKPGEIAEAVYWFSTENASFITGTTILVDGGFCHNFNAYSIKQLQFPKEF